MSQWDLERSQFKFSHKFKFSDQERAQADPLPMCHT